MLLSLEAVQEVEVYVTVCSWPLSLNIVFPRLVHTAVYVGAFPVSG